MSHARKRGRTRETAPVQCRHPSRARKKSVTRAFDHCSHHGALGRRVPRQGCVAAERPRNTTPRFGAAAPQCHFVVGAACARRRTGVSGWPSLPALRICQWHSTVPSRISSSHQSRNAVESTVFAAAQSCAAVEDSCANHFVPSRNKQPVPARYYTVPLPSCHSHRTILQLGVIRCLT